MKMELSVIGVWEDDSGLRGYLRGWSIYSYSFIISSIIKEWHGLPWGFSGQPVPVPVRTRTRTQGSGFAMYGSWVGYSPRVSKPVWDRTAGLHVYHKKCYLM